MNLNKNDTKKFSFLFLSITTLLSFLFFLLSLLTPSIAQAAANDCFQTHSDGQVICTKASSYWINITGGKAPDWDGAIADQQATYCGLYPSYECVDKTFTGAWGDWPCSFPGCDSVTHKLPNNMQGYIYEAKRKGVPSPGVTYGVYGGGANNIFSCPPNQTVVWPDTTVGYKLCRADTIVSVDLGCPYPDNSCNKGQKPSTLSVQDRLQGKTQSADPVNTASGNKYYVETDWSYDSSWQFNFTRTYNNKLSNWSNNWTYSLVYSDLSPVGKTVSITMPNGLSLGYKYNTTTLLWDKTNNVDSNVLTLDSSTGKFTYAMENNTSVEFVPLGGSSLTFDNVWQAKKITMLGIGQYLISYAANGTLNKITSPTGIELIINQSLTESSCNGFPVVKSITGLGGKTTSYTYSSCRLSRVTYPDATYKEYTYSIYDVDSVKDELGNVIDKTNYITSPNRKGNNAGSTGMGSTGVINKVAMTYNASNTVVTDALSHSSTINLTTINNQLKPTGYSTLCTWCDGIQGSSISYNANGYITSVTDYNGNITTFTYDTTRNLVTQIKESTNNLALTRQTDITYDTNWRLPATITEPSGAYISGTYNNRITTNTYNSTTGKITQKDITAPLNDGTTNTATKTWKYYYDSLGQLTSIENPMYVSGVYNDKTTMTYNSAGQITSITNGLSQALGMSSFNDYGKPQLITYPDSTSMAIGYNTRGNVTSLTKYNVGSSSNYATTITRDNRQLVTRLTTPSGAYKDIVYDATQRLTEIKEYNESATYQGKTVFTIDNMSKVTKVQVLDSVGTEIRLTDKQYNNKNMLYKDLTALAYATTYTYDSNGNLTNINDANNKNLTYTYDSLNRIATQTNPDTGVITNTYNPDDSIASITDPKSLTTSYTYNGFGETIKLDSPDTGISTNTRNIAGDITSSTDAKSITASYTYDVLHRPLTIDYPGSVDDITVTYDSCTNGIGKICTVVDSAGTVSYTYDSFGRLDSVNHTNGVFNKTTGYAYDSFSRLNKVSYPTGRDINYSFSNNKPVNVSHTLALTTTNILTNGVYDPFDRSLKSYNYGDTINGVTYTNTINKDGLVSNIATSSTTNVNKAYTFDTRLNITGINGGSTPVNASSTYDFNSRITNFNYGSGVNNATYNYNTSGDRTYTVINSVTNTYTTSSTSHRLDSLSGGVVDSYTYDNNGSQTSSTGKTFTYNNAGRMTDYADSTNNISYLVNSMGQRVKKIDNNNSSNNVWYVYDAAGQLIVEYDNSGNVINEYVYINGDAIALIRSSNLYYIYPDHLGTPRTITDTSNNPVWTWENTDPFGNNVPNDTVSGSTFTFNLRLPGQYFDNESKLNYNYFRDYNSMLGRYIQSDPIGLSGGINTFGYVGGNSLEFVDNVGLQYASPFTALNNIGNKTMYQISSSIKQANNAVYTGIQYAFPNPRLPEYVMVNVSGPGAGYGVTVTNNGTVFINGGTGGLSLPANVCLSLSWVNDNKYGKKPATDDFVSGFSTQYNFGTAVIGAGKVIIPGGQSADLLNVGTPALPSANLGYSKRLFNVFGRE